MYVTLFTAILICMILYIFRQRACYFFTGNWIINLVALTCICIFLNMYCIEQHDVKIGNYIEPKNLKWNINVYYKYCWGIGKAG